MHPVEYSKYLLVAALAYFDFATYAGLTTIDVGARVAHTVTYVGMSRARLQLPAGAFIPPPHPLTVTDVALYVAPAAMASSIDAAHHVPRVLGIGYRAINHMATTLIDYHGRTSSALYSVLLTAPPVHRSAYARAPLWYDDGLISPALPPSIYTDLARPALNLPPPSPRPVALAPPLSHYPSPLVESGVSESLPVDRRSPKSAVISLGQCTPYRVLPTRDDTIYLDWDTEEIANATSYTPDDPPYALDVAPYALGAALYALDATSYAEPAAEKLNRPKSEIALYIPAPHPSPARTCPVPHPYLTMTLVALYIIWDIVFCIIIPLVKWSYGRIFDLCLRVAAAVRTTGSNDSAPDPSLNLTSDPSTPSPAVPSTPPPPQTPPSPSAAVPNMLPSAAIDPANIPLPPDAGDNWVVPPTTVSLPTSPLAPILPDPEVPSTPPPPPTDTPDPSIPPSPENEERPSSPVIADAGPTNPSNAPPSPNPSTIATGASPDENTQGTEGSGVGNPTRDPSASTGEVDPPPGRASEADPKNQGEWTVVQRKRRPERAPAPVPQGGSSHKKTRRGGRGGKGKGKE